MKRLGEEHIYLSVRAAVMAYQAQFGELNACVIDRVNGGQS